MFAQCLRHFYPTEQMMVTDWHTFAIGGYLSYTYGDLLHIPIHSGIISFFRFLFFLNCILRETEISEQAKRNIFFF